MQRPVATTTARIFVQIPSYRDRECQWTIRDAFEKARLPDRIFVGVCWQFDASADQDCFLVETRPDQVRRIDVPAAAARGLGWARLQAQGLWQGEEFTLQIDSHMRFAPGWDTTALEQLADCPSAWPILTIYPPSYWPPDVLDLSFDMTRAVQRIRGFSPNGVLQFTVDWAPPEAPLGGPRPTASLAGGFVFGPSRMITDVPADPELYFEGEEPSLAARLWTSGFDLFSPSVPIVYHYYRRSDSRRPWDDASPAVPNAHSLPRLRALLAPEPDAASTLGRYGLGKARSLADYQRFAGVDFRACSVAAYAFHYPFVFTIEMASALLRGACLAPADGTALFLLDGEGLLFAPHHRALYRLSPEASFIWCAIEEGRTEQRIVASLAERAGIDRTEARARILAQASHWLSLGLLKGSTPRPELVPAPEPAPQRRAVRPPPGCRPIQRRRLLLGQVLLIRCWDAADAALVGLLLTALPVASGPPDQVIEILGIGDYRYVARNSLFPPSMVGHLAYLATALCAALGECAAEAPGALLHFPGAVVPTQPGPTLLLGDAELCRGLAAALGADPLGGSGGPAGRLGAVEPGVHAGMLIQIDREAGMLRAVPAPMLVPEPLHAAWRERLDLPAGELHHGFPHGPVVAVPFARPAPAGGQVVSRLIVATQRAGPARLKSITSAEAVRAVLEAAAPRPALATRDDAALLIEWVEARSCCRLVAPDVASARTLLT